MYHSPPCASSTTWTVTENHTLPPSHLFSAPGGTRTRNLWIRSPTRYPFRYESFLQTIRPHPFQLYTYTHPSLSSTSNPPHFQLPVRQTHVIPTSLFSCLYTTKSPFLYLHEHHNMLPYSYSPLRQFCACIILYLQFHCSEVNGYWAGHSHHPFYAFCSMLQISTKLHLMVFEVSPLLPRYSISDRLPPTTYKHSHRYGNILITISHTK